MNEVKVTEDWHVERLGSTMNREDVDAVRAMADMGPHDALTSSVDHSTKSFTWLADGDVGCIWGYSSETYLSTSAQPWMLGSPLIMKNPRYFLRGCRQFYDLLLDRHELLYNYIDARHTRSLRWIEWLGATVHPAAPIGVAGMPFHLHETRRK